MSDFFKNLNLFLPKKMVGIDIGTSAIKIVEISRWGKGKTLENYGHITSDSIYKDSPLAVDRGSRALSRDFVPLAIKGILQEAKIKTKEAVFSIPDFYTFCTSFDIPPMPQKEIAGAVQYNASQYVTLPMKEVTLDWKIISGAPNGSTPLKIFLVAVPNQVIQEYQAIAKEAGLELYAMEAEATAISRALARGSKKTICLMDIGVQSSTVNIIDDGVLKRSYSFNFYSGQLAKTVSGALGVGLPEAEKIKNKDGINSPNNTIGEALRLLVDPLVVQLRSISSEFTQSEQKEVQEIYLTGGTANLPGLKEHINQKLGKTATVPNCFSDFLYPPILEDKLRAMSPGFSAAMGVAIGGLEI
ncbi:MAG: hypothetical protein A3C50_02600 [Candidatus Staskawiczbacteria bacterium RIFCSPHIGHO2_02_FULL_43_16]|uniref:SHS2 domain-containing protein n=1 Tax=Candidatus Staskawiczbacteria bacterium RIFCSPHIGHO2_01_FULL_41_41 TaxID=1802203 RepID=A0A1G2HW20_9BACT|nr:MAG: hypothetical protein A2822_01490 [Candidatus Staskawiczbacteria bacterium RIFCSPHIGHO2_01_FULL_41_41]OGZ68173.1 MAG: hypothetical protein A3C50_02600 [Candidatus Staskawiczbacteria bacterium RIFCSPHIGHO2_02_FULL_43_16]OGZ74963.1 MAG: hypothetical protein A3A12_04000 [Candidatus Staskawiczbacteria bacterium RIFCSPLOWO2_01_FULL_43_17b]